MAKMKIVELTDRIERFEVLEDQFGIVLDALHAEHTRYDADSACISIHFDIVSRSNRPRPDFQIGISVYNDKGQLIETGVERVKSKKFLAIKSCSFASFRVEKPPSLIRLIPEEQ
ncbi:MULTISPECIES: hypothetical protein [Rhodococcus erythropolis group]|nr:MULTISPECIES: hypothetical protein [Rhodococcus erythropolis group]MCW0191169.1 hypothetical protein [Rhodococcus sp. (in: high G+C Gram-positive bacteria)]QXC46714.1 hypothetical protein KSE96_32020 [Rhodococcus qingshengii]